MLNLRVKLFRFDATVFFKKPGKNFNDEKFLKKTGNTSKINSTDQSYIASDIEFLGTEVNLRKVEWLVICSYNPHKNNISNHLENLSKVLNRNLSQYERFLCTGDFNSEITEFAMKNFCDIYHLKNLVNAPTCYKNPLKPSGIDLFLTNCSRSFRDTQVIQTRLSDFHKMNITVLKMFFSKQKHETVFFRNYRKFDNSAFREALNRELLKYI